MQNELQDWLAHIKLVDSKVLPLFRQLFDTFDVNPDDKGEHYGVLHAKPLAEVQYAQSSSLRLAGGRRAHAVIMMALACMST